MLGGIGGTDEWIEMDKSVHSKAMMSILPVLEKDPDGSRHTTRSAFSVET
jgi:hypothetical protein